MRKHGNLRFEVSCKQVGSLRKWVWYVEKPRSRKPALRLAEGMITSEGVKITKGVIPETLRASILEEYFRVRNNAVNA